MGHGIHTRSLSSMPFITREIFCFFFLFSSLIVSWFFVDFFNFGGERKRRRRDGEEMVGGEMGKGRDARYSVVLEWLALTSKGQLSYIYLALFSCSFSWTADRARFGLGDVAGHDWRQDRSILNFEECDIK